MIYKETERYKLFHGNMQEELLNLEENSIDAIVTDPPYGLTNSNQNTGFMNQSWDGQGVEYDIKTWMACLRVLKPGGYLLAFGGSRTFHRIACAIEDAGFEIRDTIMWLYGSGFPKSMNIGLALDKRNGVESKVVGVKEHCKKDFKESNLYAQDVANRNNKKCFGYGTEIRKQAQNEWSGWGTALKPAYEPIIVARKPFSHTLIDNVIEYGVGGINIDECRVKLHDCDEKDLRMIHRSGKLDGGVFNSTNCGLTTDDNVQVLKDNGRFPANVILTYDDTDYDEVCGGFPDSGSGNSGKPYSYAGVEYNNKETSMFNGDKPQSPSNYNDRGSASRYFYCAKASQKDRDGGLSIKNIHPTVKPTELIQYLIRLVAPKGSTILDPFMGSGSTGKASMIENVERNADYKFIGVDITDEYLPIAEARIEYGLNYKIHNDVNKKDKRKVRQNTIEKKSLW